MDSEIKNKLAVYRPPAGTKNLIRDTKILLLVGPTGAGKDSVKDKLLKTGRFYHLISHTTRRPRINQGRLEKNGREYFFINMAQAMEMLNTKQFVEAKVYSGNLYATSLAEIQKAHDQGKTAVTDLEVQGVAEYKALDPGVMAVFLLQPDFATWQERLQRRYGDVVDAVDYRRRLKTALKELRQLLKSNYYIPVINDNLNSAVEQIMQIVADPAQPRNYEPARQTAKELAKEIKAYLDTGR